MIFQARWQKAGLWLLLALLSLFGTSSFATNPESAAAPNSIQSIRTFATHGTITEIAPAHLKITIQHAEIPDFMAAMTMSFKVKDASELTGLSAGDEITFQLNVAEDESWVDKLVKTGNTKSPSVAKPPPSNSSTNQTKPPVSAEAILDYKFTNELGQAVSIHDFFGQPLAISFFFTRCPIPEFCPRLSKNFEQVCANFKTNANAPAKWHLLSITFDPESDTPEKLKAYAKLYHYDPAHWSFLTGPSKQLEQLALGSGVTYEPEGGFLNHNFRTLIIDSNGHLQMIFPTSGDLSDQIAEELIKAAKPLPHPAAK